ncbi:MAG: hypothetical protein JW901_05295 [Dehalococcoidia bacterium]|nr:hypothetical protein [Dehalococcoidia bacterium]
MKVLSVIEKPYTKDGQAKLRWEVALQKADGTTVGATSFEPMKVGDEIADGRVQQDNKYPDKWVIYSEKKGGGKSYQKDNEIIAAQVAFTGMVDLIIANKMNVADLNSETCTKFAQIIKRTAANIKDVPSGAPAAAQPAGLAGQPPSAHAAHPEKVPPPPIIPIKSMGELRTRISKAYPDTLKSVAAQDSILGDTKLITDYDAAFKKVVDYMEKPL